MVRTHRFFFSIVIVLFGLNTLQGQPGRIKGIRLGVDLSRFALPYFDDYHKGAWEISADYEAIPSIYPLVEYGRDAFNYTVSNYDYDMSGSYLRLGFEYNTLKKKIKVDQYEMFFVGLKYGRSSLHHGTTGIELPGNSWGTSMLGNYEPSDVKAHWMEVSLGIRGELFKNFFLGWSFSSRFLINKTKDPVMSPLYIPGFGDGLKNSNIGFKYSIYYRIPLFIEGGIPDGE